ncbi:MAG: hypothetical protein J6A28_04625 [Clostridia bacterium]|nr:hypothetical protein [Clostridia bacterium]
MEMKLSDEMISYLYYAPMAIKKKWKNERGQEREMPLAFVTAKCYLVGEKIESRKAGDPYKSYYVVFTWSQNGEENILPHCERGQIINASHVKAVFRTPSECQKFVDGQNAKLFRRKTQDLFDDEKEGVKAVFNKNLIRCTTMAMAHMDKAELEQLVGNYGNIEQDM